MINIENLYFSYNQGPDALLKNINLTLNSGEYLSIVGDNGSGKSTLLKLLLKFLSPTKGSICINSKKTGYVPQRFEDFNSQFPITVNEMLHIHRKSLRIKDSNEVDRVLDITKMTSYKKDLIGTLSGGQRQKIFISRALMGCPDLIILDEPSTGVDLDSQNEMYSLLKEINRQHNSTIITVEHNLNAVFENATKVLYMCCGQGTIYTVNEFYMRVNRGDFYATV